MSAPVAYLLPVTRCPSPCLSRHLILHPLPLSQGAEWTVLSQFLSKGTPRSMQPQSLSFELYTSAVLASGVREKKAHVEVRQLVSRLAKNGYALMRREDRTLFTRLGFARVLCRSAEPASDVVTATAKTNTASSNTSLFPSCTDAPEAPIPVTTPSSNFTAVVHRKGSRHRSKASHPSKASAAPLPTPTSTLASSPTPTSPPTPTSSPKIAPRSSPKQRQDTHTTCVNCGPSALLGATNHMPAMAEEVFIPTWMDEVKSERERSRPSPTWA